MMKANFFLWILLVSFSCLQAQQGSEPLTATDMMKIRTAGSVYLQPGGKQVLIMVNSILENNASSWDYGYFSHLWLAPTDGSSPARQLTFGKSYAAQPDWSPDGKQIAFVRQVEGKGQIFLLRLDGGEPQQLTSFKYGAGQPRWSPDGKYILFSAGMTMTELQKDSILNAGKNPAPWNLERPGFSRNEYLQTASTKANPDGSIEEVRAFLEQNEKDRTAKVINNLNFQQETMVSGTLSFNHLYKVEARAGAQPIALTRGYNTFGSGQWAGKGEKIICAGKENSRQPERDLGNSVFVVDNNGNAYTKLLQKPETNYGNITPSPSGKWIAFTESAVGLANVPKLAVMPLGGSEKDIRYMNLDCNINEIKWTEDENTLFVLTPSHGGVVMQQLDVATGKSIALTQPDKGILAFDIEGAQIAYTLTEPLNPSEVYACAKDMKNPKRITELNTGWLKNKRLSIPEKHSFTNEKGQTIEYWVMKPSFYESGKKYPTLLEIHGGPTAMWGPGELTMWHEYQFFCSKGYAVVYSNPRGSSGYGQEFIRANHKDWGKGPAADVLTSLDKAVAEGWADTSRLFVTGGSYAGYLVAWIIAHDQRFKAACSQRGVYELSTFFGEGNAWRLVPNYFGGYPWQPEVKKLLDSESPLSYVDQIRTPYIIFHGENDLRTGVIQSEMLYKSLKVLERPVEYVRHPSASHEITRSGINRQRLDQMLRTWEFFERYNRK